MKKELIGILICTLLISVAIIPSINAYDSKLSVIDSGTTDAEDETFTFSDQDLAELEKLLVDLEDRFYSAEIMEEKIDVLKETVVILDKYGLLPEEITVEEAQELIVSGYLNAISSDSLRNGIVSPISEERPVDETSVRSGSYIDNCLIKTHGSYPIEILWVLLERDIPTFLFETRLTNFNDVPITIKQHISLVGKRDNRVLDEFDDDLPFKLKSGHICITKYFTQFDWKNYDYRFGRFDFIWDIYIPEADSSIKLVFHGFVFYFGTIVFNPYGEEMPDGEGDNQICQSNPQSQPNSQHSTTCSSSQNELL